MVLARGGRKNGSLSGDELKTHQHKRSKEEMKKIHQNHIFLSSSLCFPLCFGFLLFLGCSKLFFKGCDVASIDD